MQGGREGGEDPREKSLACLGQGVGMRVQSRSLKVPGGRPGGRGREMLGQGGRRWGPPTCSRGGDLGGPGGAR